MAKTSLLLCSALAALIPLRATAADPPHAHAAGGDGHFVQEAAVGGLMEVQLGRIAQNKAASDDVKRFGQRMVADHGRANERLKTVATQEGIPVPDTLPPEKKKAVDQLAGLSGAAFDKAYMAHMVEDHREDVATFQREAGKSGDTPVKQFAAETLPTLREHLELAEATAAKVGAGGTR